MISRTLILLIFFFWGVGEETKDYKLNYKRDVKGLVGLDIHKIKDEKS